ncbi:MAG: ABC transporter ATP-binding protein [Firmicutes bacterium]|nr:ABC transporter ATP-binding protein [Bacillota bacterium]
MLKTENLSFSYQTKRGCFPVFQNLNVSFIPGFNVVLGPNGAGKSTLLKAIFGLLPCKGTIWYQKENVTALGTAAKTKLIAYLPQLDTSFSVLTVLEMVLLGLLPELGRKVKDEDLQRVMEILRLLNIERLAPRRFTELSGGQKKMVLVAQTLVRNPKIILLDEPVNSLDLQKQLELCCLLRRLVAETSVIAVLHDLNLAVQFAHHIVVLDGEGKLYGAGTPRETVTEKMLQEVYGVVATINYDKYGRPAISAVRSTRDVVA